MEFGVCINLVEAMRDGTLGEKLASISEAGFSFVETNAAAAIDITADEMLLIKRALSDYGLVCLCSNVMFPGNIKVVGPDISEESIRSYLNRLMPILSDFGVKTAVLGSGESRRVPDGFSYSEAYAQFLNCAAAAADIAAKYGIKIALEHLTPRETNLLTTVGETLVAVRDCGRANCGLLLDYFHVDRDSLDIYSIEEGGSILYHSHVAVPESRLYPTPEDAELLRPYFDTLVGCPYNRTVSIEGVLREGVSYYDNLAMAYKVLKALSK